MEPLLELSDVVKEFSSHPPVRPLDGLSMVVPPSTMIAVTGVSGKGKSTLLNVMGGLLRPEAGCVRYRKVDLTQATAAQLDASSAWHWLRFPDALFVPGANGL